MQNHKQIIWKSTYSSEPVYSVQHCVTSKQEQGKCVTHFSFLFFHLFRDAHTSDTDAMSMVSFHMRLSLIFCLMLDIIRSLKNFVKNGIMSIHSIMKQNYAQFRCIQTREQRLTTCVGFWKWFPNYRHVHLHQTLAVDFTCPYRYQQFTWTLRAAPLCPSSRVKRSQV
jgi:hypothetical protein